MNELERTQVAIVGAGPAGLLLGQLLHRHGIDSMIVEARSRAYCEARIRAGVIEQGAREVLIEAGVGDRLEREGLIHGGIQLRFNGESHHIPMSELTGGRSVTIYGQTELTRDPIAARIDSGAPLRFECEDVRLEGLDTNEPVVCYRDRGAEHRLRAQYVAGCDGFHGVSRTAIPGDVLKTWERSYPFAWLGILAEVPPSTDELIYARHERGFALHSMRSRHASGLSDDDWRPHDACDHRLRSARAARRRAHAEHRPPRRHGRPGAGGDGLGAARRRRAHRHRAAYGPGAGRPPRVGGAWLTPSRTTGSAPHSGATEVRSPCVRPDDLAAHVVSALLARHPDLDPAQLDDVVFGAANQAGEDNRNVARMAVLLAGLPTSIPGTTINRLCGSSLDAAMFAGRMVEAGDARCVLVGGVESMSRAPGILLKPERAFATGDQTVYSSTLGWRIVNPRMPEQWTISLGASAEKLAGIHGVSRERQDEFALRSHRLTIKAWDDGFYGDWVIPVPETELHEDENPRRDTSIEKLAKLKPAFVKTGTGTVTAGNSSPLNDGASALLIGDETLSGDPLARIVSRGTHAVDPDIFGIAPVEAANQALRRAGIGWADVEVVELNEAFASQTLACLDRWTELDPDRLNVNGGAIAIGHPLGASGARMLAGLAYELKRCGGGYGVAALCIGVGQGLAVVLEA